MLNFWKLLKKPFFVLAPMANVTDVPFRSIIAQCGRPDVFYTEFISAHGLASPGRSHLQRDLALTSGDHPIVAQFFGTKPEHFYAAGKLAKELGFDGVDVNMGCPDRSVVKQGAGIALAKSPDLAKEIILALREGVGGLPVAVKTRLGLYKIEEMETWIPELLEVKPDVLIIHGRTMKEMSSVPAHWDLIGRVVEMARGTGTIVVGNGDVTSRQQGISLAEQFGVDGVMVGRGIFHNPWLFNPVIDITLVTPQQRLELLLVHTDLFVQHWGTTKSFNVLKKFYKVYVSGWDGAASLRAKLMECRDVASVHKIIVEYLQKS